MDNTTAIKAALESLLVQADEARAFAIIEHSDSGKFVQFAGSLSSPLLLDLPLQTLSEAEFYRAVVFFRRRGIAPAEYELLGEPLGKPVTEQVAFQFQMRSVETATEIAIAVFAEIYLLANCQLLVNVDSGA